MHILPSIRFLLTVHDLPTTHLHQLDTFADQYLKRWAGLPRCATNEILHMRTAMDIKRIHTLYTETHCVSHASTRLKGDSTVNSVLDCKVQLESQFTRKQSRLSRNISQSRTETLFQGKSQVQHLTILE